MYTPKIESALSNSSRLYRAEQTSWCDAWLGVLALGGIKQEEGTFSFIFFIKGYWYLMGWQGMQSASISHKEKLCLVLCVCNVLSNIHKNEKYVYSK